MSETTKRIRFRRCDLETILDALERYAKSLSKELTEHEADDARFEQPDKWLQKREKLNWFLTNCRHIQNKVAVNLKGSRGRTPEPLKRLFTVTAEGNPREYIKFLEALAFLPHCELEKNVNTLLNAFQRGAVNGFRDPTEDGLLKVRKIDVLRLAAYLETHK